MTATEKTLSPAELAKLEHAFAADPASEAYRPLAEAYLAAGRYMEAMVVCKKGVKAHPSLPTPRLLLARVYADQNKDKKALEELQGAFAAFPGDKTVLRAMGLFLLKTGDAQAGRDNLLKAFAADPSDEETLAALSAHGIEAPKTAPAPVAAPLAAPAEAPAQASPAAATVASPPVAAPAQGASAAPAPASAPATPAADASAPAAPIPTAATIAQATSAGSLPRASGSHPAPRVSGTHPAPRTTGSHPQVRASGSRPAPRVSGTHPRVSGTHPIPKTSAARASEWEDDDELPRKSPPKGAKKLFLAMVVGIPLVVGTSFAYGQWKAHRTVEFSGHLNKASDELKHDSYDAYRKVTQEANAALEVFPDSAAAHGYLAYTYTILWGEHGEGDEAHKLAEEHLKAAKAAGEDDSHVYAADALLKTYSGRGAEALTDLSKKVKELEAQGKQSSLMFLTLGLIQMNAGDLEHAYESLQSAQARAPADPRVYAALGTLYRRRGQDQQAWQNYDFALRYEHNHPESLLGKSLLMLDQDDPSLERAAALIKKLLEADPAPSPRQQAASYLARALLVDRVSQKLATLHGDQAKALEKATGVTADADAAKREIQQEEEKGFALDRKNPELHLIKAKRLLLDGQPDQAATEVRQAIAMDGTRAQFYVELAKDLVQKKGGEQEAADALKKALQTMGDSPKLLAMLGDVYQRQGKLDDALAAYGRAIKDPKAKNPDARMEMGKILLTRREWAKAQEQLDKAAQEFLGQPQRVAQAYGLLGQALEAQGQRDKAEDIYQKALNADPDYAQGYYFYAKFLSSDRRQVRKARTLAREYLKRAPHGEYASEAERF